MTLLFLWIELWLIIIILILSFYNIRVHLRLDLIELRGKSKMQFNSEVTKRNLSNKIRSE